MATITIYKKGNFYFVNDEYYVPIANLGIKKNSETTLSINYDPLRVSLKSWNGSVSEVLNKNGDVYGTTVDDVVFGLSVSLDGYPKRVAAGDVYNQSSINKFGRNSDIDVATAPEDIWDGGGVNTQPTTDRIHALVSTSTEDAGTIKCSGAATGGSLTTLVDSGATFITDGVAAGHTVLFDSLQDHSVVSSVDSETQITVKIIHHGDPIESGDTYRIVEVAGTGAGVIHVKLAYQLDGTSITEFVVMNGTTPVNTVNSMFRLNRLHTHGVGSNGANVGTITATAATDATVSAQINPDNGQTLMAIYHIPIGYTGYMSSYYASMFRPAKIADAMARIYLRSRLWGDTSDGDVVEHTLGISIYGGEVGHAFVPHKRFSQGTDIWMSVEEVTDDNTDISAGFDIILVKN